MSNNQARGNTCICRYCFVAGVTGDNSMAGGADDARQDQDRRPVAVRPGQLCQARSIAIDNGSGRNSVEERCLPKTLVRKRARKRRRSCGDDFRHAGSAVFYFSHQFQQAMITLMRRRGSLRFFERSILAVVVVQAAKLHTASPNHSRQLHHFSEVVLLVASAVHPRVYVEKNSYPAAMPLPYVFFIFC